MEVNDVLYTPLDVPEPPEYDVKKLREWVDDSYILLSPYRELLQTLGASGEGAYGDEYPWDLTFLYFNAVDKGPGWLNGFDVKFPELSKYIFNAFGLDQEDIGGVILLPIRPEYEGIGFWHRDIDPVGLRMYFAFDGFGDDKLFMKRSKIPYEKSDKVPFAAVPISDEIHEKYLQEEVIECKIKSKNQCFFLNNQRSIHATWTAKESVGKERMAVFIVGKLKKGFQFSKSFDDMIVKSAEKFKDYAILWKEEGENK